MIVFGFSLMVVGNNYTDQEKHTSKIEDIETRL